MPETRGSQRQEVGLNPAIALSGAISTAESVRMRENEQFPRTSGALIKGSLGEDVASTVEASRRRLGGLEPLVEGKPGPL